MRLVSYSTNGFMDRDIEAALDAVSAAGFDHVELMCDAPHVASPLSGVPLRNFRSRMEQRGFRGCTVHAPMKRRVLGPPDEDWRRENVEVFRQHLHFAAAVGATALIVHPVPNPKFVSESSHVSIGDRMAQATRRSLDDLTPVAQQVGVRLLLENLPYNCGYPLLTMQELRPLVDLYPADAVGLVLDTGHAWTAKLDPAAEAGTAGTRLAGTHLQDVDLLAPADNHWIPSHGGLDWGSIRRALDRIGYAGVWTFEVARGRNGETPDELARKTYQVASAWGLVEK